MFAAAVTGLCAAVPASAVVLQEFGGTEVAGEGVISNYFTLTQHERFIGPNVLTGGPCAPLRNIIQEDSAFNADEVEGTSDYQLDSLESRRLAPTGGNATNCYAIVNSPDQFSTDPDVATDGMFLYSLPIGTIYLGFYWGSPDIYNYFRVYDGNYNRLNFTGPNGDDWGDTVDGAELIAASGIAAPASVYVNFLFDFLEDVSFIGFGSSNWAFEFDNLVTGDSSPFILADSSSGNRTLAAVDPAQVVPAPAALGLFGLGVIALSGARRRKASLN